MYPELPVFSVQDTLAIRTTLPFIVIPDGHILQAPASSTSNILHQGSAPLLLEGHTEQELHHYIIVLAHGPQSRHVIRRALVMEKSRAYLAPRMYPGSPSFPLSTSCMAARVCLRVQAAHSRTVPSKSSSARPLLYFLFWLLRPASRSCTEHPGSRSRAVIKPGIALFQASLLVYISLSTVHMLKPDLYVH